MEGDENTKYQFNEDRTVSLYFHFTLNKLL